MGIRVKRFGQSLTSRRFIVLLASLFISCTASPVVPAPSPIIMTFAAPTAKHVTPISSPTVAERPTGPAAAASIPTGTQSATPTRESVVTPSASPIPTGIESRVHWEVRTLLNGPGQPGRLYVLLVDSLADLATTPHARFLYSVDFGKTWTEFAGGLPVAPECLNDVNLDYGSRDALYASTCQGLYRWLDGRWILVSRQQTLKVAIVYGNPKSMWAIAPSIESPAILSGEGGVTWQPASAGLVHFNGLANLAIDPRDARTLYAIIAPKYAGSYLRRQFVGGDWTTMPTPLNDAVIDTGMTIDGATGSLYVSVSNNGHWQVMRTLNPTAVDVKAVSWEFVSDFANQASVTVLGSGESPQGLALYVRLRSPEMDSVVERSLDGGRTWTTLAIE